MACEWWGVLEQHVRDKLGTGPDDRPPGFSGYVRLMRDEFVKKCFVADSGAIPDSERFVYYVPCTIAHPELCAALHRDILPKIKQVNKSLAYQLRNARSGDFYCLRFTGHDFQVVTFFAVGYRRGANPKLAILMPSMFDESSLLLQINEEELGEACVNSTLVDLTLLGRVMTKAGNVVDEIYVSEAPIDIARIADSANAVYLSDQWRSEMALAERIVYPVPASQATKPDAHAKRMKDGLHSVQESAGSETKKKNDADKCLMLMPSAPDADGEIEEFSDASSAGGHAMSETESIPEAGPSFAGPPAIVPGPDDGGILASDGNGPFPFGPWSISVIRFGGVQIGWGANCHCHFNEHGPFIDCKKTFNFASNTVAHTRCLAKQWLLMGVGIPRVGPEVRSQHVLKIRRQDVPLIDEADLDQQAAALL